MAFIVALTSTPPRPLSADLIDGHVIHWCATIESLARRLSGARALDTVVYELGYGLTKRPDLLQLIEQFGIRLIVRVSLGRGDSAELLALAHANPSIGIFVRSPDGIEHVLSSQNEPDAGPVGHALDRLAAVVPTPSLPFLIAPLSFGRQRVSGSEHSSAMGLAQRTLELRHRDLGLPEPRRLRVWGQALWAMWRLERWRWSANQSAAAGGFKRASAMAETLKAVLPAASRSLASVNGFDRALEHLRHELQAGQQVSADAHSTSPASSPISSPDSSRPHNCTGTSASPPECAAPRARTHSHTPTPLPA